MASTMSIINRGLGLIGETALISLDEPTPLAEKVRRIWPGVRDAVMRGHVWKSCQRRCRLPRLANQPVFGFEWQFQLPGDFVRLVEVQPDTMRFQVEGRLLLADAPVVDVVYVAAVEDAALYDPLLCEALACKVAAELAYGHTASTSLAQSMEQRFERKLTEAAAADAREADTLPRIQPSVWAAARRGRA